MALAPVGAALALLILSSWFVVTRLSVMRDLRPWDIPALRFDVGAPVLLPIGVMSARLWLEGLLLARLWGARFGAVLAAIPSASHACLVLHDSN